ncbi:MAG: Re/Si-specific NAD(P)(+) transhydrogenase subunit alpha [Thermomicrobiales bacterium]|nr:Re/Si-specific NAD(P)(+) transhydrogenase subunit alpha [Thermomicrobiales bacterium]MCO5222864.1 Re/Si-specific NAD(P)(+) transhydrogenase subunit alpha [Thermomicrobiales bacterium]
MAEEQSSGKKLTIGIPRETTPNERRVALTPDGVKKYTGSGVTVLVERDAGKDAFVSDAAFELAGARVVDDAASIYKNADLVLKVQKPSKEEIDLMPEGSKLIAFLSPMFDLDLVKHLQDRKITALSMDAIPRTTRAQYMDALSSQATVAGYKAVLIAAYELPKFFPLLTTAAGNIPPAKVLVIGAGVAGLMAIGTARRLGAVVEAYDARSVVKEQIESLGGKYIEIDTGADLAGSGGYAKEATDEILRRQQEGLADRAAKSDVIITTAAVPGRPAPRLIPASTVERMPAGSVIVDLAAETGGNCELTEKGKIVHRHGVTIVGTLNLPSTLAVHSSQMYSKNLQNLLALMIDKDGQFTLDMDDDIIANTVITLGGAVVHEGTKQRLNPATTPA